MGRTGQRERALGTSTSSAQRRIQEGPPAARARTTVEPVAWPRSPRPRRAGRSPCQSTISAKPHRPRRARGAALSSFAHRAPAGSGARRRSEESPRSASRSSRRWSTSRKPLEARCHRVRRPSSSVRSPKPPRLGRRGWGRPAPPRSAPRQEACRRRPASPGAGPRATTGPAHLAASDSHPHAGEPQEQAGIHQARAGPRPRAGGGNERDTRRGSGGAAARVPSAPAARTMDYRQNTARGVRAQGAEARQRGRDRRLVGNHAPPCRSERPT